MPRRHSVFGRLWSPARWQSHSCSLPLTRTLVYLFLWALSTFPSLILWLFSVFHFILLQFPFHCISFCFCLSIWFVVFLYFFFYFLFFTFIFGLISFSSGCFLSDPLSSCCVVYTQWRSYIVFTGQLVTLFNWYSRFSVYFFTFFL